MSVIVGLSGHLREYWISGDKPAVVSGNLTEKKQDSEFLTYVKTGEIVPICMLRERQGSGLVGNGLKTKCSLEPRFTVCLNAASKSKMSGAVLGSGRRLHMG